MSSFGVLSFSLLPRRDLTRGVFGRALGIEIGTTLPDSEDDQIRASRIDLGVGRTSSDVLLANDVSSFFYY